MADLDDFFAKKDKKKAKGKKFLTADQIAKKLEETGKKAEKTRKEKEKTTLPSQTAGQEGDEQIHQTQEEDDEWKEFEEEKKDYSGLKIQNLQLEESEEDDDEEDDDQEVAEGGEPVRRTKKAPAGPWKNVSAPPQPVEDPQDEDRNRTDASTPATPSGGGGGGGGGSYVPPHLRNQQPAPPPSSRSKTKVAPDINSEVYFPSLSAATSSEPSGAWGRRGRHGESDGDRGFEEVRNSKSHSSRYSESAKLAGPPKLTLGNKFGALSPADQS